LQHAATTEHTEQVVLVGVGRHVDDIREAGQFVRTARRITTGHDHAHIGIVSRDSPDRLTSALIGARRHRARVDDDEVGQLGRRIESAARAKRVFDDQRVRLIDPAAERDDRVFHAPTAFRPMSRRYCMPSKWIRDAA